jgi:cell division transport system ATP-binding protein
MIEAKGVFLQYPDGTVALKDIDLRIEPGEIVFITGPSGSGKTSLIKLFMGIEYPTSGNLRVLGHPVARGCEMEIRSMRRSIGPVFQDFKLIKGRTALDNVMLGMRILSIPHAVMRKSAVDALVKVGLEHKSLTPVENLSWGEYQRVAVARAIARNPLLILADEPTGNLDKENSINILELLCSCRDESTTVIITTHAEHLIEDRTDCSLIHVQNGNISKYQPINVRQV